MFKNNSNQPIYGYDLTTLEFNDKHGSTNEHITRLALKLSEKERLVFEANGSAFHKNDKNTWDDYIQSKNLVKITDVFVELTPYLKSIIKKYGKPEHKNYNSENMIINERGLHIDYRSYGNEKEAIAKINMITIQIHQ